jgi:hypothetical protein
MGITIMGAVVTLDGYIADVNGEVGSLFEGTTRRNERDRAPGRA